MVTHEEFEMACKKKEEINEKFFDFLKSNGFENRFWGNDELDRANEVIHQYLRENPIEVKVFSVVKGGGGKAERHSFRARTAKDAVEKIKGFNLSPEISSIDVQAYDVDGIIFGCTYDPDVFIINRNAHEQLSEDDVKYLMELAKMREKYVTE